MTNTADLEKKLGVIFRNHALLTEALTHRSFLNESQARQSNERLEFLGDSVLSLLTSTKLFQLFSELPEGQLTNLRSNLVRATTLAKIARKLGLGSHLLMSRGEEKSGGRENDSLLANLFEAILGAIYLDRGLDVARSFLEENLFPLIKPPDQEAEIFDHKSRLQELTQRQTQVSPKYKVLSETGPDHDKIFTVGVFLQEKKLAVGEGKSKQDAEQDAARLALAGLE